MAWTNPITWTVSQVVSAANLNQQVRDNELFLRAFHGARMYQAAALSQTANNTFQLVTWDTSDYDTDSIGSIANDNFKVPTGFDGTWRITASVQFAANATGIRALHITKNETYTGRAINAAGTVLSENQYPVPVNNTLTLIGTWTGPLVANDTVTLTADQVSGGNLAFNVGTTTLWFEAHYLGS